MIKLTHVDARPVGRFPRAGEVWPLQEGEPFANAGLQYRRDWAAQRRPLVVKLPDETELNLDAARTGDGMGYTLAQGEAGLSVEEDVVGRSGARYRIRDGGIEELAPAPARPAPATRLRRTGTR